MSEPPDDLGTWLSEPVRPLPPPPGAFERISKRARRRKVARGALSAAAAAAVVAAAVAVPRLALPGSNQAKRAFTSVGGGPTAHGTRVTYPSAAHHSSTPTTSSSASTSSPTPGPAAGLAGFRVSSVTFVGTTDGWMIGQAGGTGTCADPVASCTSIAETTDYGQTWHKVPAPSAGAPNGPHGVSQIRFRNSSNGWVFGPELWATHDGGHTWRPIQTHGMRVIALEARNERAFAVWARCLGIGGEVAGDCTSFSLYSTVVSSDHWVPVPRADGLTSPRASSALLVLTNTQGYLLAPNGELLSGPTDSIVGWGPVSSNALPVRAPCAPGPPLTGGQPTRALLASTGSGLVLACLGAPAGDRQTKTFYYSPDQGATWGRVGTAPQAGIALSLSGTPFGSVMLATNAGIEVADAADGPWRVASGTTTRGGFSYVGMTTDQQGVAIPADSARHALWITLDYGRTWVRTPVLPASS